MSKDRISYRMEEVPPPMSAPVYARSAALGILSCLKAEESRYQYRCGCCNKMQPVRSYIVQVPDFVRSGDPEWSVIEACRINAYNGTSTGWCIKCAKFNFGGEPNQERVAGPSRIVHRILRFIGLG